MDDSLRAMTIAAFGVAAAAGSSHMGVEHLLAALTEGSTPAATVLRDLAVTRDRVVAAPGFTPPAGGPAGGAVMTPGAHAVMSAASVFALDRGVPADAEHVLLALAYSESGTVAALWHRLGVQPAAVVARLRDAGVPVPPRPPHPVDPRVVTGGLTFPEADLDAVVRALIDAYPPGGAVAWGVNRTAGRGVVRAMGSPEVLDLVRATVTDPATVEPAVG